MKVTAKVATTGLVVEVHDNGVGRPPGADDGIGLSTTRSRLQLLYGPAASLTLSDAPGGGTVVRLAVPARRGAGA